MESCRGRRKGEGQPPCTGIHCGTSHRAGRGRVEKAAYGIYTESVRSRWHVCRRCHPQHRRSQPPRSYFLTIRPLNADGTWQHKTEKEYLCVLRNSEKRGFTAVEFKTAQHDGWEKQYQYNVGKKKVYVALSQAGNLERVSKNPKSSKFGRQNPISQRWNSEEQIVLWREAWTETVNRHPEQKGTHERIEHDFAVQRSLGREGQPYSCRTSHQGRKESHTATAGDIRKICRHPVHLKFKIERASLSGK